VDRRQFDRLKATLYNCVIHGPASQNLLSHPDFRQHLIGKIEWVRTLNPNRAEKLDSLFHQINFND